MKISKLIFPFFSTVVLFLFVCLPLLGRQQKVQNNHDKRIDGYKQPVKMGIPVESPFWNTYSKRFMYAPAFDFNPIAKATFYRYTAVSLVTNEKFVFDAKDPWTPLSPVWDELPVGPVALTVEGYDDMGQIFGLSGTRVFYRAAEYHGPYVKQRMDYNESVLRALKYLYHLKPYQSWLDAKLDTSYALYCYPSKIIGAVAESMVLFAGMSFGDTAENALTIARNATDFLIRISEPEGSPLEFFPPTYYRDYETLNKGLFTRAKEFQGQLMMSYPAKVAEIYLDLFDATHVSKYFDAAIRIADTYVKCQLPSGTWRLKVWMQSGEAVTMNVCIPVFHISLFDRLQQQYHITDYVQTRDRAFRWIMNNPVKTFNWEGQFEDIPPVKEYANLSGNQAVKFASYLFEHFKQDQECLSLAEEILRFVEDQFVVWENPLPKEEYQTDTWSNPCVLEQYRYYTPVGAAATKVMTCYQKAYVATGKTIYLEKAKQFANNLTNIQDPQTGQYYTWWDTNPKHKIIGWFNCATEDIKAMLEFDKFIKTISTNTKSVRKPAKDPINNLKYFDGFSFSIMGKYHQEKNFNRLPGKYEKIVRPVVWNLSKNSSGISIWFKTNSPIIGAKWELLKKTEPHNMTKIGASGIDLYCYIDGKWQYVNSGVPKDLENESLLISGMDTTYKDFLINLPLYNGIKNIEIGIVNGYSIQKSAMDYNCKNPIVFYGTSITQGASASRPGMAYPSIVSRNLNIETINLGFSGNGKFEKSVGQALCEMNAGLIVLDCTPNSSPEIIRNHVIDLVLQIRDCKPQTPILLVESIIREYAYFRKSDSTVFGSRKYIELQNRELKNAFAEAVKIGVTNLYYLESDSLIGTDHEATVDGTHLSDLGMVRIAKKIQDKIIEIWKVKQQSL